MYVLCNIFILYIPDGTGAPPLSVSVRSITDHDHEVFLRGISPL